MKSTVTEIGPLALAFEEEKVLILFGPKAPMELREIAVIHEADSFTTNADITGLRVDGFEYKIVKYGHQAVKNLEDLGHISLYFTDPENDILPGAVYLSPGVMPKLQVGSVIEVL